MIVRRLFSDPDKIIMDNVKKRTGKSKEFVKKLKKNATDAKIITDPGKIEKFLGKNKKALLLTAGGAAIVGGALAGYNHYNKKKNEDKE